VAKEPTEVKNNNFKHSASFGEDTNHNKPPLIELAKRRVPNCIMDINPIRFACDGPAKKEIEGFVKLK